MSLPVSKWTREYFLSNKQQCMSILEDSKTLLTVPSLNATNIDSFTHGQLVRFRGMIQDMHNPEYYLKEYEVKSTNGEYKTKCGMYMDSAQCTLGEEIIIDSDKNKNADRQSFVLISIPALNEWAKEKSENIINVEYKENETINVSSEKRTFNDTEVDNCEHITKKEKLFHYNTDPAMKVKENVEKSPMLLSREHLLNFPVPNELGKTVIVKVYEKECSKYKLNEILDIVGFLSLDPTLSMFHDSNEMSDDLEIQTHHPPTSIIPRLHAVKINNVTKPVVPTDPTIISKVEIIRGDLHMILSQLLFGDILAAEYLICHLISTVYMRYEYLSLGSFPLNITNFPLCKRDVFPKDLYSVLSMIVPKSYYVECTLENLNTASFVPKKDYTCDRLTSGILQLSDNTHLVVDETVLTSGTVSENGRKNYNAISDIVKFQRINYDFQYYTMTYDTDIPVLVLSEVISFISNAIRIPIRSDEESLEMYTEVVEAANIYLKDEERLNNIRQYLYMQRHSDFLLDDEIIKVIQEDIVNIKTSNKNTNTDDFHRLMVFARLLALSHGSKTLNCSTWKMALDMDAERISRLPKRK